MLYDKSELTSAVFINFKSERCCKMFSELPKELSNLWIQKYHHKFEKDFLSPKTGDLLHTDFCETYMDHADYIAEFSTITEICIGAIELAKDSTKFITEVVTLDGKTEQQLLDSLSKSLNKLPSSTIAGYNIANYQIPFIVKRMLINKINIPFHFKLRNKKPWEINMIDVMRDYQGNMFGDVDIRLVAKNFGLSVEYDKSASELKTTMDIALAMSI